MDGVIDFIHPPGNEIYGTLAIKFQYPNYTKPEVDNVWYPVIDWCNKSNWHHIIGKQVTHYTGSIYLVIGTETKIALAGTSKPCKQESVPTPKPKTKLETRYIFGRWEKLTSKGWVKI